LKKPKRVFTKRFGNNNYDDDCFVRLLKVIMIRDRFCFVVRDVVDSRSLGGCYRQKLVEFISSTYFLKVSLNFLKFRMQKVDKILYNLNFITKITT
jgi:hypothetical protein